MALSAPSGAAWANGQDAPGLTVRASGAWSASLFVRPPERIGEEDGLNLRTPSSVGARVTGRLSKNSRLSLEASNVFDRPGANVDLFAASRLRSTTIAGEGSLPNPDESRGVMLRLRTTW